MTAKKCTAEKRDARAKSLFCLINLLVFWLMLHEATRIDDFLRKTALQHCCDIGFKWLQHCSNIATLCCAKTPRCESSRVTSPFDVFFAVAVVVVKGPYCLFGRWWVDRESCLVGWVEGSASSMPKCSYE